MRDEIIGVVKEVFNEIYGEVRNVVIEEIEKGIYYATVDNNERGTGSIIIGNDLSYLFCGSLYSLEQNIEKYKNGERTKENKLEILKKDTYNETIDYIDKQLKRLGVDPKVEELNNKREKENKIKEYQKVVNKKYLNLSENVLNEICQNLPETFCEGILFEQKDFFRFEYSVNKHYYFFAFNKNFISIRISNSNGFIKSTINMRSKMYLSYINKLESLTKKWESSIEENGSKYFGVSLNNNSNESVLYISNSNLPHNWDKVIKLINKILKDHYTKIIINE